MSRATRIAVSLAAAFAAVVGASLPAAAEGPPAPRAGVEDFTFDSFAGEYELDLDESGRAIVTITETIVARFPDFDQNRGIIRAIPTTYGDYRLDVRMLSITDEEGAAVPFERSDYEGFAEFALGTDAFVQGVTTYVLTYTVRDPVRYFAESDDDEFYWDINGNGWAQPFGTVSAVIRLSPEFVAAATGATGCFQGSYGSTDTCELTRSSDGGTVEVEAGPLDPYSTVTVAIAFDGGTVVQPPLAKDHWAVTIVPPVLAGIAGIVVILALLQRVLFWRDARGRGTIIAQYEVPDDTSLLLSAKIIREKKRALPAQLVDFAVRGIIRIIDEDPTGRSVRPTNRFSLELVDPDAALTTELATITALFGSRKVGKRVNPGTIDAARGAALFELTTSTSDLAIRRKLLVLPPARLGKLFGSIAWILVGLSVIVNIFAIVTGVFEDTAVFGWGFLTFVGAIAISVAVIRPWRLSTAGAELRDHLRGMRLYLTVAEEERMRMLQSPTGALRVDPNDRGAVVKLYERLLPYAVLWNVEDQWVEQLRFSYEGATPDWLESSAFDASVFRAFAVASVSSVRPIVTSSSSSGWSGSGGSSFSGGSGGGGFAGGGGGGGGGGGR